MGNVYTNNLQFANFRGLHGYADMNPEFFFMDNTILIYDRVISAFLKIYGYEYEYAKFSSWILSMGSSICNPQLSLINW